MIKVHLSIWHSKLKAEEVSALIGMDPEISWSIDEIHQQSNKARIETYCRYAIGNFNKLQINNEIINIVKRIRAAMYSSVFADELSKIVVYIKINETIDEIFLEDVSIKALSTIPIDLVFR